MRIPNTSKRALTIVIVIWMLAQGIAWLHFVVKTGVDTPAYVSDAMAIRNGDWSAVELPLLRQSIRAIIIFFAITESCSLVRMPYEEVAYMSVTVILRICSLCSRHTHPNVHFPKVAIASHVEERRV
jgi:hypothetical protein